MVKHAAYGHFKHLLSFTAKCIGIDEKGRIKMSRKAAMKEKDAAAAGGEAAPAADVG